ncbi:MAG: M3 family oligoendopeptidase [Geobacter sp.]|nr:M3 family oligoendopeptidase [Geobacter sp.]
MTANNKAYRWNMSPLAAADADDFRRKLDQSVATAVAFGNQYRGKVSTLEPAALLKALQDYEQLQLEAVKPQHYAHLLFAEDSTSDEAKKLSQLAAETGNRLTRELLFFDLEIMAISDERYGLLEKDGLLGNYHHYMASLRKFTPHTLAEREEQLLKLKDLTGCTAFTRLFDELSASFRYTMVIDNEEREFTGEELLGYLHHTDREPRERAFGTFLEKHGEQSLVYGTIFNTIALDHGKEMELRGYSHPMQSTNTGNELADATVEQLMSVTEANYPLAQEYFKLKARLLGLEKLKNTDIYAPVAESPKQYSFDEAKELVLQAYGGFNPEYVPALERVFDEAHIDVYPRTGKSGGAFCMGVSPDTTPYLLLNHTSNLRDVATLAHELGHALHFIRSGKQSMLNYHAPLPLAETASVFGEMLLTRQMLDNEKDPGVKIALLCAKIEDIIATTFRQIVLTRFEERLHLERQRDLLTEARICELWLEENGKLFGAEVEMIDAYRWGWSYISHFIHTRFYCYSYTFAELLVLALYRQYQLKGAGFIPGYDAILTSGGSLSPADTAALAGIDINEAGFWQSGYDTLGELIEELKQLVG